MGTRAVALCSCDLLRGGDHRFSYRCGEAARRGELVRRFAARLGRIVMPDGEQLHELAGFSARCTARLKMRDRSLPVPVLPPGGSIANTTTSFFLCPLTRARNAALQYHRGFAPRPECCLA